MKMSTQEKGYLAYQEAHENEFEQSELILKMFSGGIHFLDSALELTETDKIEMSKYVSKAKNVLLEIMSSLNIEDSGEMGEILFKAYKGLFIKLNSAHIVDDTQKIREVRDSLAELEDAWKQIFKSEEYTKFKMNKQYLAAGNSIQR